MLISTQSDILFKRLGYEKAIAVLKSAGFDAIDFSNFDNEFFQIENHREYAKQVKKVADDFGIIFNQAHSPFPTSFDSPEQNKNIFEKTIKSMEFASLLGVKNIIVHPNQHLTYVEEGNPEKLKDMNVAFYRSIIPYCNDFNITVCLENMFQVKKENGVFIVTPSTCSSKEEFKEYLDLIDSPYIAACLDIGHANLANENIPAFIKTLGDKLVALHVHEAQGNWDFHRVPYVIGNIEWDEVLGALKEIEYKGDITLEADNTLIRMPDDLLKPTACFMAEIAKSMARYFK